MTNEQIKKTVWARYNAGIITADERQRMLKSMDLEPGPDAEYDEKGNDVATGVNPERLKRIKEYNIVDVADQYYKKYRETTLSFKYILEAQLFCLPEEEIKKFMDLQMKAGLIVSRQWSKSIKEESLDDDIEINTALQTIWRAGCTTLDEERKKYQDIIDLMS